MKLAMVGVAAFVVGVAGGTVLSPARHAVVVDSTTLAADAHAEGGDSASAVADPEHIVPAGGESDVVDTTHDEPAPVPHATTEASSAEEIQALSAAVAKLPAADAGPMIERLPDADAVAVLKSMKLTEASKILDTMSPETAARLSKQLLLAGVTP